MSPDRRRRTQLAATLAGALAVSALGMAAGCEGGGRAPEPPPEGIAFRPEESIRAERAARDEQFRTDPDSPIPPDRRPSFTALSYYPFDPALRFAVRLRKYPGGLPLTITTTGGATRPATKVGYIDFVHQGKRQRLQVYHLDDLPPGHEDELFLPFLDATSGTETYGAGRYVDLAPGPAGWYVLDFNLAYHPLCAYGRTDYVCPRTPEENRLPFPVRAGERGGNAMGHAAAAARPAQPAGDVDGA